MAEIYIRRRHERRGCRRPSLLAVISAIAAAVILVALIRRKPAPEKPAVAPPPAAPSAPMLAERPAAEARRATSRRGQEILRGFDQLQDLVRRGKLLEARESAYRLLDGCRDPELQKRIEDLLGELNIRLVFSPAPMPEKVDYTVKPGDSLAKIARRFDTTVELLQKINGITGSLIRVNDRLRVLRGTFRVTVNITDNSLTLFLNGRFFKRYRVGTGQYMTTPTGEFRITERLMHPVWWRPDGRKIPYGDPENILGTHWLSLDIPGYGLHGTWDPQSVGMHSSQGCIRLTNADIEELYALLPVGTEVEIND